MVISFAWEAPWQGIVFLQRKFTLALIQLLLKSMGVCHWLPPKFGQAICPPGKGRLWDRGSGRQRVAPGCPCTLGSLKAGLGQQCAWTQLSWYCELRESFLEILRSAASVWSPAQLKGADYIQLVVVLVFKERDWDLIDAEAVHLMGFEAAGWRCLILHSLVSWHSYFHFAG